MGKYLKGSLSLDRMEMKDLKFYKQNELKRQKISTEAADRVGYIFASALRRR